MAINLSNVKGISIPQGNIKGISVNGVDLWSKSGGGGGDEPAVLLSWEHVLWSIENNRYTTDYSVGDLIPLNLGTEGNINMQIAAFNADNRADGAGKAHISFVSKEVLKTKKRMNPARSGTAPNYMIGTGTIGGWENCEMRSYLINTIKPKIRLDVRQKIINVKKTQDQYDITGTLVSQTTTDDLWLLDSAKDNLGMSYCKYPIFTSNASLVKYIVSDPETKTEWWLKNPNSESNFTYCSISGSRSGKESKTLYGVVFGFCL